MCAVALSGNNHGQLGTGDREDRNYPYPVDDFIGCRSLKIAAGFYHTIVLAADASVQDLVDEMEEESLSAGPSCPSPSLSDAQPARVDSPSSAGGSGLRRLFVHSLFSRFDNRTERLPSFGFSGGAKSKTATLTKLLSFLVTYLEEVVVNTAGPNGHTASDGDKQGTPGRGVMIKQPSSAADTVGSPFMWLIKQARALCLLLEITRGFLRRLLDRIPGVDGEVPLSMEDASRLLGTLMRKANLYLQSERSQLQTVLCSVDSSVSDGQDLDRDRDRDRGSPSKDCSPSRKLTEYPISALFSTKPCRTFSALEVIQEVQKDLIGLGPGPGPGPWSGVDAGGYGSQVERTGEAKGLMSVVCRLRSEMLHTYFEGNTESEFSSRDLGDSTSVPSSGDYGSYIANHFDTLFFSDSSRSEFLSLLGGLLSKKTPDPMSSRQHSAGLSDREPEAYCTRLRLFTLIVKRYRRMDEVTKLFHRSNRHCGMIIFQQLLDVYGYLSVLSLENRACRTQVPTASPKGPFIPLRDMCRTLAILEQCNANFVKCAIPLILGSTVSLTMPHVKPLISVTLSPSSNSVIQKDLLKKSDEETDSLLMKQEEDDERQFVTLGITIIKDVFSCAERVLDVLAAQSLNDDATNVMQYGTVLPSVLPTIIIFGISNSRSRGCVQDLLPLVLSLSKKIQDLIPWKEVEIPAPSKAVNGSGSGFLGLLRSATAVASVLDAPHPHSSSKDGLSLLPTLSSISGTVSNSEKSSSKISATTVEDKESILISAPAVPVSPTKRSTSDREKDLSHLTWWSRLLKLATVLNAKLTASLIFDPIKYHSDPSVQEMYATGCADSVDSKLSHHRMWSFVSPPDDLFSPILHGINSRSFSLPNQNNPQQPSSARSKQLTPLASAAVNAASNLHIKMLNKCVILRDQEALSDSVYRAIQQVLKKSVNAKVLVQGIEHAIFEAVLHLEGPCVLAITPPMTVASPRHPQCRKDSSSGVWKAIAKLTKRIQSQRSILVSNNDNANWLDTLTVLLRQTNAVREVILASTSMIVTCPILMSSRVKKHPALRRVLLVVICSLRWAAAVRLKLKSSGVVVVEFVSEVLESMTQGLTTVGSPDLLSSKWERLMHHLRAGSTDVAEFSQGIMTATATLQETPFSSVKHDVLSSLIIAWRDRLMAERQAQCMQIRRDHTSLCCTESIWRLRKDAAASLESYLCCAVRDFSVSFLSGTLMGTLEINFFSLVLSLLHLLSISGSTVDLDQTSQSPPGVCSVVLSMANKTEILESLKTIFIAIDVRSLDPNTQIQEDRTSSAVRARGSSRDRNKALRKVSNSLISLLQSFSCCEHSSSNKGNLLVCSSVMNTHNDLLVHLQGVRLAAHVQVSESENIANSALPSRKPSLENNDVKITLSDAALPAASAGHLASKESSKRRCQELIVRPLEFFRVQEGFVVQGDNLLSNFKGIDFTLATWIFIDKKAAVRQSFVTGKVSHHDAWPLVVLRNDGKLDIIYGHSNDFECMVSVSSIPLYTWTHVAVVVEQKKIKLFINGVVDCQVGTKGNARAVMYPIVVGRCPQGLRTHVDHVRVGFDGLLAQYRHYTRALSPIHVRVVFDQGESFS